MSPMGGSVIDRHGNPKITGVANFNWSMIEEMGRKWMPGLKAVIKVKGELAGRVSKTCPDCKQKGLLHLNGSVTLCPCATMWLV